MLESIKKGFGLTIGVTLGCIVVGAVKTLVEGETKDKNENPEEVEEP